MLAAMRFAAGPPHIWHIGLTSGAVLEVWADSYATEPVDGHWQFSVLVDASVEEQREVRVSAYTDPPSQRCEMVVARIPIDEVETINGGWSLSDEPNLS